MSVKFKTGMLAFAVSIALGTNTTHAAEDEEVKLIEVSTPELSDVVRIEDFYGRTK